MHTATHNATHTSTRTATHKHRCMLRTHEWVTLHKKDVTSTHIATLTATHIAAHTQNDMTATNIATHRCLQHTLQHTDDYNTHCNTHCNMSRIHEWVMLLRRTWLISRCVQSQGSQALNNVLHTHKWVSHTHKWVMSHRYMTWLTHMRVTTHSYVCHDSHICVSWLIRMRVMPHWFVCNDSLICTSWITHMCVMPRAEEIGLQIIATSNSFKTTSFHRSLSKFQTSFHKSKRESLSLKRIPGNPSWSTDPNISSLISSVRGFTPMCVTTHSFWCIESYVSHICVCVSSASREFCVTHICMHLVAQLLIWSSVRVMAHMNATHEWVMVHMIESWHIWVSHGTHESVMAHMHEPCHVWMNHGTYEWVMAYTIGSWHVRMSRNTYVWLTAHMNESWYV